MHGDFTRLTFDPSKHYARVLMQQGRVLLDADWNEMNAIMVHHLRTLARTMLGPYMAANDNSFKIREPPSNNVVQMGTGEIYVNGILCEHGTDARMYASPTLLPESESVQYSTDTNLKQNKNYLFYLNVWERHQTYQETDDRDSRSPGMRERALNGLDTTTRTKIEWQIKVHKLSEEAEKTADEWRTYFGVPDKWKAIVAEITSSTPQNRGKIMAIAQPDVSTEACLTDPDASYRGLENQLYRVEVHRGGEGYTSDVGEATFKWSRDNGAVTYEVEPGGLKQQSATIVSPGRDRYLSLKPDQWVEIVDDKRNLQGTHGALMQVKSVEIKDGTNRVTFTTYVPDECLNAAQDNKVILRRWDFTHNEVTIGDEEKAEHFGLKIKHATGGVDELWIQLEDGIKICFSSGSGGGAQYQTGDYWLIPARVSTRDIEWPLTEDNKPQMLAPYYAPHYYAPLAVVRGDVVADVRRVIQYSPKD